MRHHATAPIGSLFCVLCWLCPPQPAIAQGYTTELIAEIGDTAPGTAGGTFAQLIPVGSTTVVPTPIDTAGNVYFQANVTGGSSNEGIFRADPAGAVAALVLEGALAPSTGGGTYSNLTSTSVSDEGTVVFSASVVGGTAISGFFVHMAGVDSAVVFTGAAAPAGGTLSPTGMGDVNDAGEVVFHSFVGGVAPVSEGIFVATGGLSQIAVNTDAAPASGGGSFSNFDRSPAINDAGDLTFIGNVSGGSVTRAIYRYDAANVLLEEIAHLGQAAPVPGGGTIVQFSSNPIALDDTGTVYFGASVTGGSVASAIFAATPGSLVALATAGSPAPGTGGATYTAFDSPTVAAGPRLSFIASVLGVGNGIFTILGGPERAVVLNGDPSPTGAGDTLVPIAFRPSVNPAGSLAFLIQVNLSGGGSTNSIFRATPPSAVPALSLPALAALAAALLGGASTALRRRATP